MKKIGFVTRNKVLAQSLSALIKNTPGLGFDPYVLLNHQQAALDAEVLKIDVAVVEMTAGTQDETEMILFLCEQLRGAAPACRILLLVPQDNKEGRGTAMTVIKRKLADDYVFFDVSLSYLLAKLEAM